MAEDIFQGYKGDALEILKKYNVRVWGQAEIDTSRGLFKGTVLPRSENDDDQHIVLKIETGYNIGIDISTVRAMIETGYQKANYKIPEKEFPYSEDKPSVKLFGTGGTIASRLDYVPVQLFLHFHQENYMELFPNLPISAILIQKNFLQYSAKIWALSNILHLQKQLGRKSRMA